MRRLVCFLMLFSVLGCSSLSSRDEETARLFLRRGASQLEAGDYPSALKTMLEAERLDDSNPIIQNNLGLAYLMRGRPDLAEQHLRQALKLNPSYTEAKVNLGRVLNERARPWDAIPILEQAVQDLTYPKPANVYLNLGISHFNQKSYAKARDYFKKTLDYNRDNCEAQNYLGRTYFETNDFKTAAELLDRAVSFCKTRQFDEPHYYSGLAYYQLGDRIKAETRLEEVLKLYSQGRYQDKAKSLLEIMRK